MRRMKSTTGSAPPRSARNLWLRATTQVLRNLWLRSQQVGGCTGSQSLPCPSSLYVNRTAHAQEYTGTLRTEGKDAAAAQKTRHSWIGIPYGFVNAGRTPHTMRNIR